MGRKTKLKQEKIDKREKSIAESLKKEVKDKRKGNKRLTYKQVKEGLFIDSPLKDKIIRPEIEWKSKSYNEKKQKISYLKHLFVKYPVPNFLYESFFPQWSFNKEYVNRNTPDQQNHELFQGWLVTLGTGAKYHKVVKEHMTKKEANLFLKAPSNNTINSNVWWARAMVMGLRKNIFDILNDKMLYYRKMDTDDSRYIDIFRFFTNYQDNMNRQIVEEIVDFLRNRIGDGTNFVVKGRTLQSMIEQSNQWHIDTQRAKANKLIEWKPLPIKDWTFNGKLYNWRVNQLTTNKQLLYEGRKMRHCVSSYVYSCERGRTFIFTIENSDKESIDGPFDKKATIEVTDTRRVVQVRAKLNALADADTKFVLRHWAGDNGLTLNSKSY